MFDVRNGRCRRYLWHRKPGLPDRGRV